MQFEAPDYRDAALLRLKEAQDLYDCGQWVGTTYLAGRAVEAVLRALLWRKGRQQEVGHSIRGLLSKVGDLGLLTEGDRERLLDRVNDVAIVWNNDLRFASTRKFLQHLRAARRDRRIGTRPVTGAPDKANAKNTLEASEAIVTRGDMIWNR